MRVCQRRRFQRCRTWLLLAACSMAGSAVLRARPEAAAAIVRPSATATKPASPAPNVPAAASAAPLGNAPPAHFKPGSAADAALHLRDPFRAPEEEKPGPAKPAAAKPRPPGIHGLLVEQLRLQGIVREEETHRMLAMVAGQSNLSYFLHEGDKLYDGEVSRITPDTIYIRRTGGAPAALSNEIALRIGPGAGGQE